MCLYAEKLPTKGSNILKVTRISYRKVAPSKKAVQESASMFLHKKRYFIFKELLKLVSDSA